MNSGKLFRSLVLGFSLLVAMSLSAAEPPANPEAVAAYNEGMRQLDALSASKDFKIGDMKPFDKVEALFRQAIAADLPHGYYGMACMIYTVAPKKTARISEAWQLALYASHRNVAEAEALIISLIYAGVPGESTFNDVRLADLMLQHLHDRAAQPEFVTGAPGTVAIASPSEARRLVDKTLGSGACGTHSLTAARWQLTLPSDVELETARKRLRRPEVSPANPEAVKFYKEGMSRLSRPIGYVGYRQAESLFDKAIELGLPHGHYGKACAIIGAAVDTSRVNEARSEINLAADNGVLEAKAYQVRIAAMPQFHIGDAQFRELWRDTVALALTPDLQSGAPGTVDLGNTDAAVRLVWEIAVTGRCGEGLYPRFWQPASPTRHRSRPLWP